MAKAAAEKTRLRVNTTAEERGEWVQLFESSGKSAPEFCRELGLAESTFAVWRRQVRGESAESCTFTVSDTWRAGENAVAVDLRGSEFTPGVL